MFLVEQHIRQFQTCLYHMVRLGGLRDTTKSSQRHTVEQTCCYLLLMVALNVTFLVTVKNDYEVRFRRKVLHICLFVSIWIGLTCLVILNELVVCEKSPSC